MPAFPDVHEFFVEGKDRNTSHVLLHISEPTNANERKRGVFFALGELAHAGTEEIQTVQSIIDETEELYYGAKEDENANAFEAVIEDINRRSKRLAATPELTIHVIVGIIFNNTVIFAYHGAPSILLWYKKTDGYKYLDICDEEGGTPQQLFSDIVEGSLKQGDVFYVATPQVRETFSNDRLQKILSSRTITQTTDHMKHVLEGLREDVSFGGVFFHIPKTQRTQPKPEEESVSKLVETQAKTKNTLNPSLLGSIKQKMSTQAPYPGTSGSRGKQPIGNVLLIALGRALVFGFTALFYTLKYLVVGAIRILVTIFFLITNKSGKRQTIIQSWQQSITGRKKQFASLPLLSKILFVSAIVLIATFVGSVAVLNYKKQARQEAITYQQLTQAVVDKKDAAEASMIYGNDEKALTLLKEASDILDTIPEKTPQQEEERGILREEINRILHQLQKLTIVSPTPIAELTQAKGNANTSALTQIDGTLLAFGPNDEFSYAIDPDTGAVEVLEHEGALHLTQATVPKENDSAIFLTDNSSIASFNPTPKTITLQEIVFPQNNTTVRAIAIYNQKLYTVDTTNNQIYKHSKTQTGYDKGTPWLEDGTPLAGAQSLAIDGALYVLKENGVLHRFHKGIEEPLSLSSIEPRLENPTSIWTYNDTDYLYLLEPGQKRIVVFDKDGKFKAQYTALEWSNPSAFVVDEEAGKVYVLDNNTVYSFDLGLAT